MKNIHILPTDKPSRLHFTEFFEELIFTPKYEKLDGVNIYITSDEEIKDGDWMIRDNEQPIKVTKDFFWDFGVRYYKIILTTDQDLIKNGVQAIDDEFLEWFVKNPSCEEVEVENEKYILQHLFKAQEYKFRYKIIIPKQEPKKVLTEEDIFNQKDIDAVTDYINKEQQKQHLIDMMESDKELGLYDDIKANRIELVCKDCSDSLEDCTCIVSTIDFPKEELSTKLHIGEVVDESYPESFKKQETLEEEPTIVRLPLYYEHKQEIKLEEVFNDEKKENIKKFIDEINNPSQPNDKLKQAFEKYSEYLEDYENKNTYEHGFKDGAKWQQERSYSEEDVNHLEWIYNRMINFYDENKDYDYMIKFKEILEQLKNK